MSPAFSLMLGIEIVSLLVLGVVILEYQHTRKKYAQLIHALEAHSSIGKETLSWVLVWFYVGGIIALSILGFLMLLW